MPMCSIYIASPLPIYSLHPTYTTYTCFIAYLYTIYYKLYIYIYTTRKLPKDSPYTTYKLDIKHLELHKHCLFRTVVVRTPGGNHLGGAVVIPYTLWIQVPSQEVCGSIWYRDIYCIYIYIFIFIFIHIYIHKFHCVFLGVLSGKPFISGQTGIHMSFVVVSILFFRKNIPILSWITMLHVLLVPYGITKIRDLHITNHRKSE